MKCPKALTLVLRVLLGFELIRQVIKLSVTGSYLSLAAKLRRKSNTDVLFFIKKTQKEIPLKLFNTMHETVTIIKMQ